MSKRSEGSTKRQSAKLARDRGQAAMKKAKMNHAQWTQQFDPLFQVKGKERHRSVQCQNSKNV